MNEGGGEGKISKEKSSLCFPDHIDSSGGSCILIRASIPEIDLRVRILISDYPPEFSYEYSDGSMPKDCSAVVEFLPRVCFGQCHGTANSIHTKLDLA